jgi:hypothetical protein
MASSLKQWIERSKVARHISLVQAKKLQSYAAPFNSTGTFIPRVGELHQWRPNVTRFICRLSGSTSFILQWDEPFFSVSGSPGSASNLNVRVFTSEGDLVISDSFDEIGDDPYVTITECNIWL